MVINRDSPSRAPRRAGISQADVARAVKGAMQAGMNVLEVIATRDGIRIRAVSAAPAASSNSWDEVLSDG